MSLQTQIGQEANIFVPAQQNAEQIVLSSPILSQRKLRQIMGLEDSGVPHEFIDLQYDASLDLKAAILDVCDQAEAAVRAGKLVLLLSDRYLVKGKLPIQALLATGAVHHRLVKTGLRCKCNILVETGTARDAHHFACLIGYGATAVYPYLAYQTLFDLMRKGAVKMDADQRQELGRSYRRGIRKGLFKIMSKMGISTVASYRSAQLFEIVGLGDEVVSLCFEGSDSRIQGADFADLKADTEYLVNRAWDPAETVEQGGLLKYMHNGEYHMYNPDVIAMLQSAVMSGDYEQYKEFAALVNDRPVSCIRDLLEAHTAGRCDSDRGSRVHHAAILVALRQRRHVAGRAVARGARGARHRHESPGRALQFRRGRRGPGALRHREEFQDQAGGVGPLRRDARIPHQCRSPADQGRAGREARRGRPAARPQGERHDRALALRTPRRGPDIPAAASRYLFDRGSRAVDLSI